jgi:hypothetical protein
MSKKNETSENQAQCAIQNVVCSCGGGNGVNHPVGENGCFRYHVTDPKEIPHNRRRIYNPEWFKEPVWIWSIADYWITEYTLLHQRMYAQDANGNWTRPKSKDSVNSLCGDW